MDTSAETVLLCAVKSEYGRYVVMLPINAPTQRLCVVWLPKLIDKVIDWDAELCEEFRHH